MAESKEFASKVYGNETSEQLSNAFLKEFVTPFSNAEQTLTSLLLVND